MTTTVANFKDLRSVLKYRHNWPEWPAPYVYIGRPSKWGNPFVIGKDGTREEVIEKYRGLYAYADHSNERVRQELKDKILVCWCKPLPCHGDVLAELADS